MTLPVLLSVPHAGLRIPPEVDHLNLLENEEIIADGDEGAAEIYDLEPHVAAFVTTDIARAYVDLNRAEDDRRKDGVVKTHTCWDVPIYDGPLSEDTVEKLLEKYHRPYHERLRQLSTHVKLGIDCHTMAHKGPPVGPDPGKERPLICLSNADGTCPMEWIRRLAAFFEGAFQTRVSINHPFKGGYIIKSHASEIPWVQLEMSRTPRLSNQEKRHKVLQVLQSWCK
jgi:N-formylglutamate deformylase